MTLEETLALLTYANQIDPRVEVTGETTRTWHDLIGDIDVLAVRDAVRVHYQRTTERLMPADVRKLVNGAPDAGRYGRRSFICPQCNCAHGGDPCHVLITKADWEARMGYTFRDLVADATAETRAERAS